MSRERTECPWCKPPGSGTDTCEASGLCNACCGRGTLAAADPMLDAFRDQSGHVEDPVETPESGASVEALAGEVVNAFLRANVRGLAEELPDGEFLADAVRALAERLTGHPDHDFWVRPEVLGR